MKARKFLFVATMVMMTLAPAGRFVAAQDGGVIKIASQSPLSGGQSSLGIAIRNGAELAIEQLGAPLVEMGYTIEFVPFDDEANAEKGVSNAQQIVNDPEILGVVGHLNSGVAIPSSEVYNDNDLVMVSPANTNPNVTDRGYPTVNRICGRDDLQGPAGPQYIVENAADLGVESVYVLHDTTTYGEGIAQFFRDASDEAGVAVLGYEGTEEKANFDGIIQPILSADPDLIYFGGIYDQTAVFINQARAAGYEGLYMGPDGFDSSDFASIAGEGGVGTIYTTVAGKPGDQFVEDYTAKFDSAVQPYAVEAYDSAGIIIAAITSLVEENGAIPTRAEVAEAVRATEGYEGLTGVITFDDNGDLESANYYVKRVISADPLSWSLNEVLTIYNYDSPLVAAMATEEPAATEEAE